MSSYMKKGNLLLKFICLSTGLLIQTTSVAQLGVGPAPYCMPTYNASSTPCNQPGASNTAGNIINDFIDSFNTSGATTNITDNNNGCQTQTLSSALVNYFYKGCPTYLGVAPGQVITCNFKSGIIYDQGFAVFIDWNSNSLFDLPSERVTAVTGLPIAATWTTAVFTVPVGQPNGTYRMRVRCAYVTTGGLIDPCINYSYGEVQDYNVVIGGVCVVLPIELLSFDGQFRDKQINLNWNTATETNSDHFTVERSYDNEHFELISKTSASENSNIIRAYSAVDKGARKNEIIYYRLKEFDRGKTIESFSKTITVFSNDKNIGFDLYPNPANTEMKIVMADVLIGKKLSIELYDSYGKKVLSSESEITNYNTTQNLDISALEKGTYFVKITDFSGDIIMKKTLLKL
jgi:hypothetical protein